MGEMKKTLVQFAINPLNYSNPKTKPRFLANQTPLSLLLGNRRKEYFVKKIQHHLGNGVRKRGPKMRNSRMKTKIVTQKKPKVNPLDVF